MQEQQKTAEKSQSGSFTKLEPCRGIQLFGTSDFQLERILRLVTRCSFHSHLNGPCGRSSFCNFCIAAEIKFQNSTYIIRAIDTLRDSIFTVNVRILLPNSTRSISGFRHVTAIISRRIKKGHVLDSISIAILSQMYYSFAWRGILAIFSKFVRPIYRSSLQRELLHLGRDVLPTFSLNWRLAQMSHRITRNTAMHPTVRFILGRANLFLELSKGLATFRGLLARPHFFITTDVPISSGLNASQFLPLSVGARLYLRDSKGLT